MAGKKSVSSSRDWVGMRRVGCAHVILPPDKEASTRRGNRHPTRKQTPDKETNTRQGNKHPTRKQAPDKEASTQQGNRHLFPIMSRYVLMLDLVHVSGVCDNPERGNGVLG